LKSGSKRQVFSKRTSLFLHTSLAALPAAAAVIPGSYNTTCPLSGIRFYNMKIYKITNHDYSRRDSLLSPARLLSYGWHFVQRGNAICDQPELIEWMNKF